jgi:hypothetical protein
MTATQSVDAQECRVTTTVRFLDKSGQPVTNITADQVNAHVGNSPAKVLRLEPAGKPAIVLLIDASTSMRDEWQHSLSAGKHVAALAGENITLVLFSTRIRGKVEGSAKVQKALDDLTGYKAPGGATALYDSLLEVASDVKQRSAAIIAISDGRDNQSTHSSDQTIAQLLSSSAPPIFDFVMDYERRPTYVSQIARIAESTGGFVITSSSEAIIAATAAKLMAGVMAPFTIVMQSQTPLTHAEKLQIEVVDSNMKKRKDIHVTHAVQIDRCDLGR